MPPAQQQNQNQNPGPYILAMGGVFFVAAWLLVHDPMATFFLIVIQVINAPFSLFPGGAEVSRWVAEAYDRVADVTFPMILTVGSEAGKPYRVILVLLACYIIYYALRSPVLRARQAHDRQTLMEIQSRVWKACVPFLKRDLTQNSKGPFARSLSAPEYARKHKLVQDRQLDVARTKELFIHVLGPKWEGPDQMRDYEKALFAVFALRILREKDAARDLLDDLNETGRKTGKVNPAVAHTAFERVKHKAAIRKVFAPHGYVSTVLFAMLIQARVFDGILQPALFLWVKEYDRTLYSALNRAPVGGRRDFTAYIEGAAISGQWQAEIVVHELGRRLTAPYVEGAIRALREDLFDTGVINSK